MQRLLVRTGRIERDYANAVEHVFTTQARLIRVKKGLMFLSDKILPNTPEEQDTS